MPAANRGDVPADGASPGPGVDARGLPVIDPTANVLSLVEAANRRQDDLRESDRRHTVEIMALRSSYDEKLREKESQRIDAIRAVDVGNVQRAAEVAAAQAEALRLQVQATATAAQTALAAALDPIQRSIDDLRRSQYEAQGQKTQIVESHSASAAVYALVGLGIAVMGILVGLAGFLLGR